MIVVVVYEYFLGKWKKNYILSYGPTKAREVPGFPAYNISLQYLFTITKKSSIVFFGREISLCLDKSLLPDISPLIRLHQTRETGTPLYFSYTRMNMIKSNFRMFFRWHTNEQLLFLSCCIFLFAYIYMLWCKCITWIACFRFLWESLTNLMTFCTHHISNELSRLAYIGFCKHEPTKTMLYS